MKIFQLPEVSYLPKQFPNILKLKIIVVKIKQEYYTRVNLTRTFLLRLVCI